MYASILVYLVILQGNTHLRGEGNTDIKSHIRTNRETMNWNKKKSSYYCEHIIVLPFGVIDDGFLSYAS